MQAQRVIRHIQVLICNCTEIRFYVYRPQSVRFLVTTVAVVAEAAVEVPLTLPVQEALTAEAAVISNRKNKKTLKSCDHKFGHTVFLFHIWLSFCDVRF